MGRPKGALNKKGVQRGKVCRHVSQEGERCKNRALRGESLCAEHQARANDFAQLRLKENKMTEGYIRAKCKEIVEQEQAGFVEVFAKMREELLPSSFDAIKEYEVRKAASTIDNEHKRRNAVERYVYAMWMAADPMSRVPSTLPTLAAAFGLSPYTVERWSQEAAVLRLTEIMADKWMKSKRRLIDYALIAACCAGDTRALALYYRLYPAMGAGVKEIEVGEEAPTEDVVDPEPLSLKASFAEKLLKEKLMLKREKGDV